MKISVVKQMLVIATKWTRLYANVLRRRKVISYTPHYFPFNSVRRFFVKSINKKIENSKNPKLAPKFGNDEYLNTKTSFPGDATVRVDLLVIESTCKSTKLPLYPNPPELIQGPGVLPKRGGNK